MSDPLEALLHRCHRDELLPLAELVKVPGYAGMGLRDLARNTARGLRRLGAHQLANAALRGGEGPAYREVLAESAQRAGVDAWSLPRDGGEEGLELALLKTHFARNWERLPPARRAEIWERLGLPGDAPVGGEVAVDNAAHRLGAGFGYVVSQTLHGQAPRGGLVALAFLLSPAGCVFRMLLAPLAPLALWWALRRDDDRLLAGLLEVARLRQIVLHRVTIGVVGSPSTGKDAAIRALFGIDTGNISPVAGSTREVAIHKVPGATALYVVNTPGLGDVVEAVTEEARQVLDHIDVYLYLVNAEGGVQAREKADYAACVASGKPVLAVVNKVDVLRPRDKDRYLADARAKLGAPEEDFVAAAFDPLPQLSPEPINRDVVHAWLARHLGELGKDPGELPALAPWSPAGGEPVAEPSPDAAGGGEREPERAVERPTGLDAAGGDEG